MEWTFDQVFYRFSHRLNCRQWRSHPFYGVMSSFMPPPTRTSRTQFTHSRMNASIQTISKTVGRCALIYQTIDSIIHSMCWLMYVDILPARSTQGSRFSFKWDILANISIHPLYVCVCVCVCVFMYLCMYIQFGWAFTQVIFRRKVRICIRSCPNQDWLKFYSLFTLHICRRRRCRINQSTTFISIVPLLPRYDSNNRCVPSFNSIRIDNDLNCIIIVSIGVNQFLLTYKWFLLVHNHKLSVPTPNWKKRWFISNQIRRGKSI